MRLGQVRPRQPLSDVQITLQEWKFDPEMSIKHDDLCARAWEYDYERPIFDAIDDNTAPLIHPKLQNDLTYHPEKSATHQEPDESVPQNFFPQLTDYVTERVRISIRNMMRKRARNSITLFLITPAVQNTCYVTIRSPIVITLTDNEWLTQHQ